MNVCFNGQFFPFDQPLLGVQNSSYKWGDGLFETMKVYKGKLVLSNLHFNRLFASLQLLQMEWSDSFSQEALTNNVLELCRQNDCGHSARIRLAVFRDDKNFAGYSIEAMPLDDKINEWQQEGLTIDLYPYARKTTDAFANLKSANYLPYLLANKYAVEKKLDDVLVLNVHRFLCDSSKANLFVIKNKALSTPALHQGCINGVMRRATIDTVKSLGIRINEAEVSEDELSRADEVFLTNAIQAIRWVKQYKQKQYTCSLTEQIFNALRTTIYTAYC